MVLYNRINKILPIAVIVFFVLGNFVFAESVSSGFSGEGMMEGMEGLSEEELRLMAKSKMVSAFSEEEFQMMMKSKDRMIEESKRVERKEAFSYEHKGYEQKYYAVGPSYEGYSTEQMVFGMLFHYIGDDIDPRDIKEHCSEPEKIADIVTSKLREKAGTVDEICSRAEEEDKKCAEHAAKGCAQTGTPVIREGATEQEKIDAVAYSCPVNKEAIIKACRARNKHNIEQQGKNAKDICEKRFSFEGEHLIRECERFKKEQICESDIYVDRCLKGFGIKKEDAQSKSGTTDGSFDDSGKREQICHDYPVPQCGEGQALKQQTDNNGCVYYYCEQIIKPIPEPTVCAQDLRKCPDGSYVGRNLKNNCEFEPCPVFKCPEPVMPTCSSGMALEKGTDSNGCGYYYCKQEPCPEVSKQACNADERLEAYYDSRGCITGYQCIKQHICPEVQKPACAEGQSLTTKTDDKECIVGYECISIGTAAATGGTATGGIIGITGQAIGTVMADGGMLDTYDDYIRQCEKQWGNQQNVCASILDKCDKSSFIEKCREQEEKNIEHSLLKAEEFCSKQTNSEIAFAEQRCSRIEEDKKRCLESGEKRCGHAKEVSSRCREILTEEKIREFIVNEARKRCRFSDKISGEEEIRKSDKVEVILAVLNTAAKEDFENLELYVDDLKEQLKLQDTTVYKGKINPRSFGDIKLFPFVVNAKISTAASSERAEEVKTKIVARAKVEEAATELASLRDSDLPREYVYIIEDKASDVLDVSEQLGEFELKQEGKDFFYKLRLFFGFAKKVEEQEIKQLGENNEKLQNSIETLAKLIEEVPSDVAKAVLKEQVGNLKKQKDDIDNLIKAKEKKAKGIFG